MKALINTKKSSVRQSLRKCRHLCWLVPMLLLTTSCITPTIFSVQFPEGGQTYVGNELVDFVIKYTKPVNKADIFLNGTPISTEFNYGPAAAVGSINNLKKYLKQGTNTLTVDPMAFGPTVTFVVDNAGPEIVVTYGKTNNLADVDPNNDSVTVKGLLRDASGIASLSLRTAKVTGIDQVTGQVNRAWGTPVNIPVKADNTFDKSGISIVGGVTIYSFTATDIHGQTSTKEFLADSNELPAMAISNAMRIAIGDSFVGSLRPIIASGLYNQLKVAPIDIRWKCWNDTNITGAAQQNPFSPVGAPCTNPVAAGETDNTYSNAEKTGVPDGGVFNPGLNPVAVDIGLGPMEAWVKRVYMESGSTALLNNFKIESNNRLKIDMVITDLTVALNIKGSINLVLFKINLNIDIAMTIGRTVVDTYAVVQAINKDFNVELADANIGLYDISNADICINSPINLGCFDGSGLLNIIRPILTSLLPGIINPILEDNLNKIVIGACMYPEGGNITSGCKTPGSDGLFNWAINVETLKTDNLLGAGNPYDLIVGLETQFNLLKADANLFQTNPTLGPVYVEDPIDVGLLYNSLGGTGNNLTVAISSNAINQGFSALYQSGYSHFTMVDGVMSYGADPAKPVGTKNQTRIRLYPEAPPVFTLNPISGGVAGKSAAKIGYEAAVLYFDIHDGTSWKNQIQLKVDFSIAANIAEEDNVMKLGVEGSPTFNLRSMVNNTGLPVTQGMLQSMVDVVFMYFVPQLAEQAFEINLADMADTSLNGSQVLFQTDADAKTQGTPVQGTGPDGKSTCSVSTVNNNADGIYDYVCETINFTINTNAVTSVGDKGTNLMFQMEARDPDLPAAPAIPRFDLDNDNVIDYKDNCAPPILMQVAAVKLAGGLVPANIDTQGNPTPAFKAAVLGHINRWVAKEQGVTKDSTGATIASGDYLKYLRTGVVADAGSGTPADPDTTHAVTTYGGNTGNLSWWNEMRKGDTAITVLDSTNSKPWIQMLYSNGNQRNTDGDVNGELCENDNDRDYIYLSNGLPVDTCPTVKDPSNNPGSCTIDQADYVLFKNQQNGLCISHANTVGGTVPFKGVAGDNTNAVDNFAFVADTAGSASSSQAGVIMQFKACNTSDLTQRFYVDISPRDGTHTDRGFCQVNGNNCTERLVNIFTNEYKQTEPGFYDTVNHHYVASTIADANARPNKNSCNSNYWNNDHVIVTTMCGYDANWRDWVLSLSGDNTYPFLIESWRVWEVYGVSGGISPGRRDCLFNKSGYNYVDADNGSCFPGSLPADITNRQRASFQILLGPNQVPWAGAFSDQ